MSRPARAAVWVLAILGCLAFAQLWWLGIPLLYRDVVDEPARVGAITTIRAALLAGLVGAGALGTFWVSTRTYRVTQRGHITDRYTRSIEQLGSDNLDVRLGGIYALEQIAEDSDRNRDQETVVEVLSAFVRVHSDRRYRLRQEFRDDTSTDAELLDKVGVRPKWPSPTVDVQAALTVLGRLPYHRAYGRAIVRADLSSADLYGAALALADLRGAKLQSAELREAKLFGADLRGANLRRADLRGADLNRARLEGADLYLAKVDGADFRFSSVTTEQLREADEGTAPEAPGPDRAANAIAAAERVSAEYADYRRRVDRDRESVLVGARAQSVSELLTVLDDLDRAEAHGDLTGLFKAVADNLVAVVQKLGLEPFGLEGERFDPSVHEAVQHEGGGSGGPTVAVVSAVLRPGYRIADRVLRPAMVAVTDRPDDGTTWPPLRLQLNPAPLRGTDRREGGAPVPPAPS